MNCCTYTQEANTQFGEARARQEAQEYTEHGLNRDAQAIVDAVGERGVKGTSLLEVGSGIGSVTFELLKKGVAQAANIEASSAYLETAQALAKQAGVENRVTFRCADFTQEAGQVASADIVVMHRVVCCYPHAPALVAAAAQHSLRLLTLSYPVDTWYMRLYNHMQNLIRQVKGSSFRMYIHPPRVIFETAAASGLRLISESSSGTWRIAVFERSMAA
jgi:2-polyprenyl-3-methyl-5-hydroxy-6-metoxy-1,4-benzoquinol methylase